MSYNVIQRGPPSKRLLLPGRERLSRRGVPLHLTCGGFGALAAIANEEQRNDARALLALMRRVTKHKPRMWGPTIVGFGSYHYKYASGHEGDMAVAGFAMRGRELVVYIAVEFEGRDALLAKLGKHKIGKVCLYIRRLADVDLKILETLVVRSIADTKRRYP